MVLIHVLCLAEGRGRIMQMWLEIAGPDSTQNCAAARYATVYDYHGV